MTAATAAARLLPIGRSSLPLLLLPTEMFLAKLQMSGQCECSRRCSLSPVVSARGNRDSRFRDGPISKENLAQLTLIEGDANANGCCTQPVAPLTAASRDSVAHYSITPKCIIVPSPPSPPHGARRLSCECNVTTVKPTEPTHCNELVHVHSSCLYVCRMCACSKLKNSHQRQHQLGKGQTD